MIEPALSLIISQGILTALRGDATLVTSVTQGGLVKMFFHTAPSSQEANLPYVVVKHVYGGEPAKSPKREFDQLWLVYAVGFDLSNVSTIAGRIRSALVGLRPTFTNDWLAWEGITISGEYNDATSVQGQEVWKMGVYIRVRGVKNT